MKAEQFAERLYSILNHRLPADEVDQSNFHTSMMLLAAHAPGVPYWFEVIFPGQTQVSAVNLPASPYPISHRLYATVQQIIDGWDLDDALTMASDNHGPLTDEEVVTLTRYTLQLRPFRGQKAREVQDDVLEAANQLDTEMRWRAFYGRMLTTYVQQEFEKIPVQEKWMPKGPSSSTVTQNRDPNFTLLAQQAYRRYGNAAGWINHAGHPMPQWDELPKRIQEHWKVAVNPFLVELDLEAQELEPSAVVTTEPDPEGQMS